MSDTRPFTHLGRSTVSERVRDELHTRIASGEIQPGSPLPAERVLAEQFGVARTSVREAIQALIALGVIERRGNRSFVVEQVPGSELPAADGRRKAMRSLIEARRILELVLFELAASRATARDRNEVLDLARQPMSTDLDGFALLDRQFHSAIAAACGNPVLVEVYGRVVETLVQADLGSEAALEINERDDPQDAIRTAATDHLRIAEAYAAGDVDRMLAAVEAHLGGVEGRMSTVDRMPRVARAGRAGFDTDRTVGM
jgi:GntR family transcriptional repressor for pyruvate dehydrogenase complex